MGIGFWIGSARCCSWRWKWQRSSAAAAAGTFLRSDSSNSAAPASRSLCCRSLVHPGKRENCSAAVRGSEVEAEDWSDSNAAAAAGRPDLCRAWTNFPEADRSEQMPSTHADDSGAAAAPGSEVVAERRARFGSAWPGSS